MNDQIKQIAIIMKLLILMIYVLNQSYGYLINNNNDTPNQHSLENFHYWLNRIRKHFYPQRFGKRNGKYFFYFVYLLII